MIRKTTCNTPKLAAVCLCLALASSSLFGGDIETKTASTILKEARTHNIDPRMLFTLIDIESAFNPNAICVETKSRATAETLKSLASDTIRIKVGKTYHSKWWMVSIFPSTKEEAVTMSKTLKSLGFSYDAGLMQINSGNFKQSEAEEIFDPAYNIRKGAKILKECIRSFKHFVNQIECYNRGAGNLNKSLRKGKRYYPYYQQYRKKWAF